MGSIERGFNRGAFSDKGRVDWGESIGSGQ